MEKITVKTKSGESVILMDTSVDEMLDFFHGDFFQNRKIFMITDTNVYSLYKGFINKNFSNVGFYILPAGEKSKSYQELEKILIAMKEYGLSRSDGLISFGGGVVGDIAGLAASLYMRGISYLQIPTTLLAMVDSSVGGKCAIDFCDVKNLIGAFYQPNYVLINSTFLNTLPKREIISGLGEIIKYGMLENKVLKKLLPLSFEEMLSPKQLSKLIDDCIVYKTKIVEKDEKDFGERKRLNLGHTTAHAIELYFGLSHGESVLWGLYFETCLALKMSRNRSIDDVDFDIESLKEYLTLIKRALSGSAIPDFSLEDWIGGVQFDKKNNGMGIAIILPLGREKTSVYYYDEEYYRKELLNIAKNIREDGL